MVASTVDASKEESITAAEKVNQGSYVSFHNAQIFNEGKSFSGNERNMTWINTGDAFADVSELSGADSPNDSRAVIAADFDDDGDVDLFVHSIQRERHAMFRNDALGPKQSAGFLKLRLRATSGQYEGIGATVIVQGPKGASSQVLSRGAGFVSCQVPELVFGLGSAASATVEVQWPGGKRESFGELQANSRMLLVEGSGKGEAFAAHTARMPDPLPGGIRIGDGDRVPLVTVLDGEGQPTLLDVAALAGGKPVMLNFWASYCAPCVGELELLEARHQKGDLFVIALSTDVAADQDSARAILAAKGVSFPSFYLAPEELSLPGGAKLEALVDLKRLSLPTTLLLGAKGQLESTIEGPIEGPAKGN